MEPFEIHHRGLMLVLSSPSGAGKTTISRKLLERDENLVMSVSITTRPKRPGEVAGVDYHFVDLTAFNLMVNRRQFLEYARVFGHYYGTPREPVEKTLAGGNDVLFDIDWQGTEQLVQKAPDDLVRIFILPPSTAELERRLKTRAQDSDEVVAERMARATDEMSHWAKFDYIIVCTVTGSTHAGMLVGFAKDGRADKVIGIDASGTLEQTRAQVMNIARNTADLVELGRDITEDDLVLIGDYAYPVYGVPSAETNDAIRLAARMEGMMTDPVYEGKSMQGLIDLVRKDYFPAGSKVIIPSIRSISAARSNSMPSARTAIRASPLAVTRCASSNTSFLMP